MTVRVALAQTAAMAVDAYRELHARRLFWITLILSGLVVLAFAAVGIDERGLRLLWFGIDHAVMNTDFVSRAEFYRGLFTEFGVKLWLTWIAAILALISTAGIFPELITGGSIDLWLSRPISRWRLFTTKFLLGLAFVVLQVSVFTVASILVLGLRGGVWEPGLLLAIPIVTVFFSYLFALCVLFGVLTRSTIAAVLMTLLAWAGIGLVNAVEGGLFLARTSFELELVAIERDERRLADIGRTDESGLADDRARAERAQGWIVPAHRSAYALKTLLPKTADTVELLNRAMIDLASMPAPPERPAERGMFGSYRVSDEELTRAVAERLHQRPLWWVLGTSLLFVGATAGLAGWVFCRRDY